MLREARALGRLWPDHSLELPIDDVDLESSTCSRHWQLCRPQGQRCVNFSVY
jgi:hypothetical protein